MKLTPKHFLLLIIPVMIILLAFRTIIKPYSGNRLPGDSLVSPDYMDQQIKYQTYFPFIRYENNFIEWTSREALAGFYKKLRQTPVRKLKILHLGDSHLQADIPSGYIRERMQDMFGYGGRGLVFPYRAAGTHSAYDYKTTCTGNWEYTRNTQKEALFDMGIIGATIHTKDSTSSFRFIFREGFIRENFTVLKLYCRQDSLSYDIKLKTSSGNIPIYIDCGEYSSQKPYILITLSKPSDTLDFIINKTEKKQSFFECYGLMIESREDNGVLYCSSGINGAGYRSLNKQRLFEQHLAELTPDLIILDLGANDFYGGTFNAVEIEKNMVKIIDIIQRAAPEASIILTNSQDIYYRRRKDILACRDFMELTRRVAAYRKCAFYDYYDISGGKASMLQWYKKGLAKPDKIHLTTPGYNAKGNLYLNAMLNSYVIWLKNHPDSLVSKDHTIDTTTLKKYFVEEISFKAENNKSGAIVTYNEPEPETEGSDRIYYIIRSGDNLGSIAERYHVSVKDLQYWNGLSGTKIIAGESLVVYKKTHVPPATTNTSTVQPKNTTQKQPVVINTNRSGQRKTYKVVSGDSLWSIAKKYNTTVDKIKQANSLKTDKLNIGQTLIIP